METTQERLERLAKERAALKNKVLILKKTGWSNSKIAKKLGLAEAVVRRLIEQ